jgi:hypothetical protein
LSPGLEYIYRQLMAQKIEVPSLERLKQLVDTLIIFNLDITKIKSKKDISIEIKKIIEKIKIIDNHIAYVEESKRTYRRLNNEWIKVNILNFRYFKIFAIYGIKIKSNSGASFLCLISPKRSINPS